MVRHKMRKSPPRLYRLYSVLPVIAAVAVILWQEVHASEFPDRECCDPIYPPMIPDPDPLPPALPTATTSSSLASPIGRSGNAEQDLP